MSPRGRSGSAGSRRSTGLPQRDPTTSRRFGGPGRASGTTASRAGRRSRRGTPSDTHGDAATELRGLPLTLHVIASAGQAAAKRAYVERLGAAGVVALGNGRNDRDMLATAALGVAVLQGEGAAPSALAAADVVAPSVANALELLLHPKRLVATLRE